MQITIGIQQFCNLTYMEL